MGMAPALNMMPTNAMSPLNCRMPQQQHFQGSPMAGTPMAAPNAAAGKPPMMPATPATPYAPRGFAAATVPRPWLAAPAPVTALPTTPPSPLEQHPSQMMPAQATAPTDTLKLLLGGDMGASPEEVFAKLQAARPEVY